MLYTCFECRYSLQETDNVPTASTFFSQDSFDRAVLLFYSSFFYIYMYVFTSIYLESFFVCIFVFMHIHPTVVFSLRFFHL